MQLEVILSGPLNMRESARAALTRAGVTPDQFVNADHGFHPDHVEPDEGFLAYRADTLEAANAANEYGWRLRLHRDSTPLRILDTERPQAAALDYVQGLETRLRGLELQMRSLREGGPPPIAGGALESPPYVIAADQHPAQSFRYPFQSLMSATGVVNSGDVLVSPNSPTAMNVLVAAGLVWIPGTLGGSTGMGANAGAQTSVNNSNGGSTTSTGYPTTFTSQSNYLTYQDGTVTLSINSADPTNPRIDLVCATVQDAQYSGAGNQCVLQVVTGVAGATPAPPVPPASSVILSSVWVPAAASSILSTYLNDFRPPAGGRLGTNGHTNISASQSTSSTTYTTLATPDQVSVILPANGLIAVWYQATWQMSATNAAAACIFLGANRISVTALPSPVTDDATPSGLALNTNFPLFTTNGGLASAANSSTAYTGDVTTGQVVGFGSGGGPCYVFAAAGTYTVSVQFKASSGSVTASNRKLWVQALSFS